MNFLIILLCAIVGTMFVDLCCALPAPFSRDVYSAIDLRLFDWPLAEHKPLQTDNDGISTHPISCYTQLDESFVDDSRLYRLNNSEQVQGRACMLRIPTGTRFTMERMNVKNAETYVGVMAGSYQANLPMWTGHIHEDQKEMYGPWHVPCQNAYLVFGSRAFPKLEWVDFRLVRETEDDRRTLDDEECFTEELVSIGRN